MGTCDICGTEFIFRKPTQRSCSRKCANASISRRTAKKRGDTLRGRGKGKAYRKRGGRHEHRVVAEEKLGRPLRKGEVVHHINGDRLDNRPENLVVTTQADHVREHARQRFVQRFCSIDGCERVYLAKGFCGMHYQRQWKKAAPGS